MKHKLFISFLVAGLAFASLALTGCGSREPEGRLSEETPAASENSTDNSTPQSSAVDPSTPDAPPTDPGEVQIHGAGASGIAPVTGTENIAGGGGGVQQAAKDRAQQAAGQASSGSLGQGDTGDESGE